MVFQWLPRRVGFERAGRRRYRFLNALYREFVQGRPSGGYCIELCATGRTPKFDTAKFDYFGMKPFRAAKRASYSAPLVVRHSKPVMTTGA